VRRVAEQRPSSAEIRVRARSGARARRRALRDAALPVLQCTIAAPIAWVIATHVVGHSQAFFAPIAALISLGVGLGQRPRRAIELTIGVAVGIGVANLLISAIGTGALSIALVVALGMIGALALSGGSTPLLVTQAAVAGVLVATIQPPTHGVNFTRFIDALVGGLVGLAVAYLLPADPLKALRRATRPVIDALLGMLGDLADALDAGDADAAQAALDRGRAIELTQRRVDDALDVARDMVRLAPARRGARLPVERYARGAVHLDRAVRNTRVLARSATRAIQVSPGPPGGGDALRALADGVIALRRELEEGDGADAVADAVLRAVRLATAAYGDPVDFSESALLGQVRMIAVDLLLAAGNEGEDARAAVGEAGASPAPEPA
jgi:uncharacterized membrane protein YgaE (UPF0421/DUF939 family)